MNTISAVNYSNTYYNNTRNVKNKNNNNINRVSFRAELPKVKKTLPIIAMLGSVATGIINFFKNIYSGIQEEQKAKEAMSKTNESVLKAQSEVRFMEQKAISAITDPAKRQARNLSEEETKHIEQIKANAQETCNLIEATVRRFAPGSTIEIVCSQTSTQINVYDGDISALGDNYKGKDRYHVLSDYLDVDPQNHVKNETKSFNELMLETLLANLKKCQNFYPTCGEAKQKYGDVLNHMVSNDLPKTPEDIKNREEAIINFATKTGFSEEEIQKFVTTFRKNIEQQQKVDSNEAYYRGFFPGTI